MKPANDNFKNEGYRLIASANKILDECTGGSANGVLFDRMNTYTQRRHDQYRYTGEI